MSAVQVQTNRLQADVDFLVENDTGGTLDFDAVIGASGIPDVNNSANPGATTCPDPVPQGTICTLTVGINFDKASVPAGTYNVTVSIRYLDTQGVGVIAQPTFTMLVPSIP